MRMSDFHQGETLVDAGTGLVYRLRQPAPARPLRCAILVHGLNQNETTLAGLAPVFDADTQVIWVRGPLTLGPDQYACFHLRFTPEGPIINAPEAEAARLLLIRFVAAMQARYGVAPAATLIAGFSQGGIMSASVGLSAPGAVAGFAILSGRILPELAPHIAPREQLRHLDVLVAHGHADDVLPVTWAERSDRWLTELGVRHTQRRYDCKHNLAPDMAADFAVWARRVLGSAPVA